MRKFLTWEYLSHSFIDFSSLGYVQNTNHDYNVFTQADPVLRVRVSDATAATVSLSIDTGAPDHYTLLMELACTDGETLYIPVGDALRDVYRHELEALPTAPQPLSLVCSVTAALLDSDGVEINHADMTWRVYEAVGCQLMSHQPFLSCLPDRWRAFAGAPNPVTVPVPVFDVEFTRTYVGGRLLTLSVPGTGGSLSFAVSPNNRLQAMSLSESGGDPITSVFDWQECGEDKVLVAWWSTELGGWKSQCADVVAETAEAVTRRDVYAGFGLRTGTAANFALSLRFPMCSQRDVAFLRDLMASGSVYVRRDVSSYASSSGSGEWLSVRVRGDIPTVQVGRASKNVDFEVITNTTDEL